MEHSPERQVCTNVVCLCAILDALITVTCMSKRVSRCSIARLLGCSVARLLGCSVAPLLRCFVAPLLFSAAPLQSSSYTFMLRYFLHPFIPCTKTCTQRLENSSRLTMPTNRGVLKPVIAKLGSVLSKFNQAPHPLGKKEVRQYRNLTLLVRIQEEELLESASRHQKFVRIKARKLLSDIGQKFGIVVLFLVAQVTTQTQLAFLHRGDAIEEIHTWRSSVSFSPLFVSAVKELQSVDGLSYPISPGTSRRARHSPGEIILTSLSAHHRSFGVSNLSNQPRSD